MNLTSRLPSPTARDATRKALRCENPNKLSSRDTRVLVGLPSLAQDSERTRLDSFFTQQSIIRDESKSYSVANQAPPHSTRETRPTAVFHCLLCAEILIL
ncbi:hypothetical protein F4604DRAFT_1696833 [Suillus subluteus]|nr:hypothetical protein F4604DRAFT_1696833 [Suillus subluteus]